jgi:cephalosporin hydroxylase
LDDRKEFEESKRVNATAMATDVDLQERALGVFRESDKHDWSYQWNWLGVPIIQVPPDIVATQEVIWEHRPQFIVETGVARGGSLILYASILELIGEGRVIGIDIDIRDHNRESIESHPMSKRIDLIQGSSIDAGLMADVAERIKGAERVMVILDSNHTHSHVLDELRLYAPLVTQGQFLIVADTIIEDIPAQEHRPRPWGPGDNPATALKAFLEENDDFEQDPFINAKVLVTSSGGGYLRRVKP